MYKLILVIILSFQYQISFTQDNGTKRLNEIIDSLQKEVKRIESSADIQNESSHKLDTLIFPSYTYLRPISLPTIDTSEGFRRRLAMMKDDLKPITLSVNIKGNKHLMQHGKQELNYSCT